MKPYSYDLRKRIFNHSLNNPVSETAHVFGVSINTVYLLKRLFFETGDVKPRNSSRKYAHLISPEGELYLQVLIIEQPDISLEELRHEYHQAYGVTVSIGTMSNTVKKLRFSYKKNLFRSPQVTTRRSEIEKGVREED
jgi:transposase